MIEPISIEFAEQMLAAFANQLKLARFHIDATKVTKVAFAA
jgi:hypothetical protein